MLLRILQSIWNRFSMSESDLFKTYTYLHSTFIGYHVKLLFVNVLNSVPRRIKTIQNNSFLAVCAALGLLADETELYNAPQKYYLSRFNPLGELFALILVHCEPPNPLQLWSDHTCSYFSAFVIDICEDFPT